ncbi:MAG: hypothetical protein ACI4PW_08890 [Alphaproteobacteria bacterium]
MLRKFVNFVLSLIFSGILLHRSTVIGALCAAWIFFGAPQEDSVFQRMLTPDLYLFMLAFLVFYRITLKRIYAPDGELDYRAMGVCLLGDMAWAVVAMMCFVPFFMMFDVGSDLARIQNSPELRQMMFLRGR